MIPAKPHDVTWTDEQWQAIYEDNKNIIVSAGAGSGKTAVLTERVIRKLKDGVNVNQLLILTFTKAAAGEMADRIRKKIKKIPALASQLNLLDSSYITTFDSFALSIVKRYHYLLNLSPNIGIIDASVIGLKKQQLMDELFLEYYQKEEPLFLKLISTFCTKDDKDLQNYFLTISNKLDLLSNKLEYLENYLTSSYDQEKITQDINSYLTLILTKRDQLVAKINEISLLDAEFALKLEESITPLLEVTTYDQLVENLNIKLPSSPRGSDEAIKNLRSEISELLKEIKALAVYNNEEEIRTIILDTKPTVKIIIELIIEFTNRLMNYKQENNSYEFNDIAILAIQVVKNNPEVQAELRDYFKEIMIDEYQDTNDLQEEFISYISNHNVYMVGDIKQSIYRFRNANPYIFKNKYDTYSTSTKDLKIDLNKNFRSRNEVLDNINLIFTLIMNDTIGGADYLASHQMIFGNQAYLKEEVTHSNDLDIYQYSYDKELGFTKEEIEAFIIAKDITQRYQAKQQVFDKDTGLLRNIRYEDFAIIMDRATSFDLYKKIFNYFKIPLTLLKDEKMNEEADIHVISNLIRLLIHIKEQSFNTEFKYLFVSIMRSFLIQESDPTIFNYIQNNNYQESTLYQKCLQLTQKLDYITPHQLIDQIITTFNYYEAYLSLHDLRSGIVKITKLRDLAINLESLGYDIKKFSTYLEELLKVGYKIEYKIPDTGADAVKMMTIHKSKGLEYPLCYFSGLYKEFNISDLKEKFLYDKEIGLIVPYFKEGIAPTIYKDLLKEKYLQEEISEKIRLFYVALTRAREKMILIKPTNDKEIYYSNATVLDNNIKSTYRSLADMIDSVQFRLSDKYQTINLDDLNLTKEYSFIKKTNYQTNLINNNLSFEVQELSPNQHLKETKTFSKQTTKLITKEEAKAMQYGLKLHEYLEFINLKKPNYSLITDPKAKIMIEKFLSQELLSNINQAQIYQEYEFIYEENDQEYHGIIDLILEYPDHIDIIDYKLKNTTDEAYYHQLQGYYQYIKTKTTKTINLYLYSLLESKFTTIDTQLLSPKN